MVVPMEVRSLLGRPDTITRHLCQEAAESTVAQQGPPRRHGEARGPARGGMPKWAPAKASRFGSSTTVLRIEAKVGPGGRPTRDLSFRVSGNDTY